MVDASVLVATLLSSGADGLWCEEVIGESFLLAPHLAIIEALNVLRRLELRGEITALEAASAQSELRLLDIELLSIEPFADRIWQLRHNLTCYDAWYVAIAEAFECPLATLDRPLSTAAGPRCEIRTPG